MYIKNTPEALFRLLIQFWLLSYIIITNHLVWKVFFAVILILADFLYQGKNCNVFYNRYGFLYKNKSLNSLLKIYQTISYEITHVIKWLRAIRITTAKIETKKIVWNEINKIEQIIIQKDILNKVNGLFYHITYPFFYPLNFILDKIKYINKSNKNIFNKGWLIFKQ